MGEKHPDLDLGGVTFNGKDIWIGGNHGVPTSRIVAWLARVWRALNDCLVDAGIEVPDNRVSRIEGDDDHGWPPERLHFHWSILRLGEQDWPRQDMPEAVAEVLVDMFARLRARDHAD